MKTHKHLGKHLLGPLQLIHPPSPSSWVFYPSFHYLSKQVICQCLCIIFHIIFPNIFFLSISSSFSILRLRCLFLPAAQGVNSDYTPEESIFFMSYSLPNNRVWLSDLEVFVQQFLQIYSMGMGLYLSIKYCNRIF